MSAAMFAVAFVLPLLAASGHASQEPAQARALALLAERRYGEALRAAAEETDALARARAEAEVFHTGRDFEASLERTRAALEHAPSDLRLLQLGASAALWLQDGRLALEFVGRLEAALGRAGLESELGSYWRDLAGDYRSRADGIVERIAQRDRALARARAGALSGLGMALVALLYLARKA